MAEYHEDGMVCDVTILEDTSDNEWERYKLKVNKVLQSSSIVKDPEVGEEFSVEKARGISCSGLWHLFGYKK